TQTYAGLPFGVAMIQTMQHVQTGLDEEVLVQIVLHTNTGQSHGGTVTLAGEGLVQLLMTKATGNVGTDSTLSEMVNGFQSSHATVNAFTGEVGFQALVSTQGGAQHGVGGREEAEAATDQSVVGQIASAVGGGGFGGRRDFNRASAVGEHRRRR